MRSERAIVEQIVYGFAEAALAARLGAHLGVAAVDLGIGPSAVLLANQADAMEAGAFEEGVALSHCG